MDTIKAPLTCGHFIEVHVMSSVFDFPSDPIHCRECGVERQLALELQAKLFDNPRPKEIE